MKTYALAVSVLTLVLLATAPARAQQVIGVPGSPSATTTIDGRQLPLFDAPTLQYWAANRGKGVLQVVGLVI